MVHFFRLFLSLVIMTSFAIASPQTSTIPNWFVLENRLYEAPLAVLVELNNLDISTWSDQQKVQYYDLLANAYLVFSNYESAESALT